QSNWYGGRYLTRTRLEKRPRGEMPMLKHHHSFGRESIATGLIGASVVALWFLILDAVNGQPLSTPSILGQVIIFGHETPVAYPPVWPAVAAYTALHIAGF